MIPTSKLVEIASLYEEYMYSPDPLAPNVKRAGTLFRVECQKLYDQESVEFRRGMTIERYVGAVVVVEINRYLDKTQTRYPTV